MTLRAGALVAALLVAPSAWGDLVAERITPENFASRSIGGPDSIGGVGDWYLANDRVEVIVDDPSRRFAKAPHGGTLVAAGVRGRPGDGQFARIFPVVNMDQRVQLGYDRIRVEHAPDGSAARLVVTGSEGLRSIDRGSWIDPLVPPTEAIAGVIPETVYEVRPGEPFVRITTRLENRGDAPAPIFAYGEAWMRGGRGPHGFVGNTLDPELAAGFHHRDFKRSEPLSAIDAMTPSTFIAVSGLPPWPPVTYALTSPERVKRGVRTFGVTGRHIHLMLAFVGDPDWREVGLLEMAGALQGEIAAGDALVYERLLVVTPRPDVASATDIVFPLLGHADGSSGIAGAIEPPDVRAVIHVRTAAGHPVTQITSRTTGPEAGRYAAVLPPGDYELLLRAPQREDRVVSVRVAPGSRTQVPVQRYAETGWLVFDPGFRDGGSGRLLFEGLDGTPDPRFDPELIDFRLDGEPVDSGIERGALNLAAGEPRRVPIASGRYRLTATRGIEFGIATRVVEVPEPGAVVTVAPFDVPRQVRVDGALSADMHVHAEASDDSGMTNEAQLRSFLAAHVDVLVSTDHDQLGNYAAALDALSARERIRVVGGVELTGSAPSRAAPYTIAHHNAWPVPYVGTAHRKGAPPSLGGAVADLYAAVRRDFGARVVQLNHALPDPSDDDEDVSGTYFMHLGNRGEPFDASRPLDEEPNRALLELAADGVTRAIDFDAMEVMNGLRYGQYLRLRELWYALQRQGFRRTATGNSDTHAPAEIAGFPRNYVLTADRSAGVVFDASVRAGAVFATTGPLITRFRVNGGGLGELVAAPGGSVEVEIEVAAADWVPVEEVRLLLDGEVVRRFRDLGDGPGGRLAQQVALTLERDGFLTVEAGAALDAEAETWIASHAGPYTRVAPGAVPAALTNPIFVDVDVDGRFAAPGLRGPDPFDRLARSALLVLGLALAWWLLRRRAYARSA